VTARTGPPGEGRAPAGGSTGRGAEVEQQRAAGNRTVAIFAHTPVTTVDPRWTGCPMGCGQYGHEPPCPVGRPLRLSCHACGALDWSARQSLDTCWSVCPMRAVA
jgi:hypothetical protein